MASRRRPAKWMQHGVEVDYHPVIGGPAEMFGLRIESGPSQLGRGGPWVVWLTDREGRRKPTGCVSVEAITRRAPSGEREGGK